MLVSAGRARTSKRKKKAGRNPVKSQAPIDLLEAPKDAVLHTGKRPGNGDVPLVSVIMLSYNHELYIRQALDGVLMQETSFPFEVIVHDDASTDDSAKIILEYADKDARITPILQSENLYQRGLSLGSEIYPLCRGKYIAACECDDYWIDSNKLQLQVNYLEQNEDCTAVYHNCVIVDGRGEPDAELARLKSCYAIWNEGDFSLRDFAKNGVFPGQTATSVIRASLISNMDADEADFYSKLKMNGDRKKVLLAAVNGRVHVLAQIMSAHRVVIDKGGSWSAQTRGKNLRGWRFQGESDARRYCKKHSAAFPNEWALAYSGIGAIWLARKNPSDDNLAQAAAVYERYPGKVECIVHLAFMFVLGFPGAVVRKAKRMLIDCA